MAGNVLNISFEESKYIGTKDVIHMSKGDNNAVCVKVHNKSISYQGLTPYLLITAIDKHGVQTPTIELVPEEGYSIGSEFTIGYEEIRLKVAMVLRTEEEIKIEAYSANYLKYHLAYNPGLDYNDGEKSFPVQSIITDAVNVTAEMKLLIGFLTGGGSFSGKITIPMVDGLEEIIDELKEAVTWGEF